MNVLFYTTSRVSVENGGTERITSSIATTLRKRGHFCYSAYSDELPEGFPLTEFDGEINICHDSLEEYLKKKKIDVFIVQQMTKNITDYRNIIDKLPHPCRLYSVLHFAPGSEEILKGDFKTQTDKLLNKNNNLKNYLKYLIIVLLFPLYNLWFHYHNIKLYKQIYDCSDGVILLSKNFISEYKEYAKLSDTNKFHVIHNSLSFDVFFDMQKYNQKENLVIVVSRLEEIQKRISHIIKVWKLVEKVQSLSNWKLIIIGHGNYEGYYKKMANGLHRIEFVGRQNPLPYYQKAKILMMSSITEGWGLTLTEAQQMACVPIAFNSYSSITDVIENNKNGILVEYANTDQYFYALKHLMEYPDSLKTMASNGVISSKRFCNNEIVDQWEKLILLTE